MRILKTNHWSEPAYNTIEEAGLDISTVMSEIAKVALSPDINAPKKKTIRIKGKKETLILSSKR